MDQPKLVVVSQKVSSLVSKKQRELDEANFKAQEDAAARGCGN